MAVKGDFIMPNHILIMDYLAEQRTDGKCLCAGKKECQQCLFRLTKIPFTPEVFSKTDVFSEEDVDPNAIPEIDEDKGAMLKVIERRVYEQNRYMFPYYNWKTYEQRSAKS